MKNKLKVEVSPWIMRPDVKVIVTLLHVSVYWPKQGLVEGLLNNVEYYLSKFINAANAYFIFDGYLESSIKTVLQLGQIGIYQQNHKLAPNCHTNCHQRKLLCLLIFTKDERKSNRNHFLNFDGKTCWKEKWELTCHDI